MLEGDEYTGFGPDLLVRLSELALEDDALLTFDMSDAIETPALYATALDLIANDCKPTNETDCDKYDIIIGDYYVSSDRALRIHFTPAWLHTRITALRGEDGKYESFMAVNDAGGKVCVPQGTLLPTLIGTSFCSSRKLPVLELTHINNSLTFLFCSKLASKKIPKH